jgi:hypothetical protein
MLPSWLATLLSIFTSSALKVMFDIITTRKAALLFGVACLVVGALGGWETLILIGAGAIVWVTYAESRDDKQGK